VRARPRQIRPEALALRVLRTRAGLRAWQVADALGVTPTAITVWERTQIPPDRLAGFLAACLADRDDYDHEIALAKLALHRRAQASAGARRRGFP
jgi:DNA-binding XRE family transcriptional regulator